MASSLDNYLQKEDRPDNSTADSVPLKFKEIDDLSSQLDQIRSELSEERQQEHMRYCLDSTTFRKEPKRDNFEPNSQRGRRQKLRQLSSRLQDLHKTLDPFGIQKVFDEIRCLHLEPKCEEKNKNDTDGSSKNIQPNKNGRVQKLLKLSCDLRKCSEEVLFKQSAEASLTDISASTVLTSPSWASWESHNGSTSRLLKAPNEETFTLEPVVELHTDQAKTDQVSSVNSKVAETAQEFGRTFRSTDSTETFKKLNEDGHCPSRLQDHVEETAPKLRASSIDMAEPKHFNPIPSTSKDDHQQRAEECVSNDEDRVISCGVETTDEQSRESDGAMSSRKDHDDKNRVACDFYLPAPKVTAVELGYNSQVSTPDLYDAISVASKINRISSLQDEQNCPHCGKESIDSFLSPSRISTMDSLVYSISNDSASLFSQDSNSARWPSGIRPPSNQKKILEVSIFRSRRHGMDRINEMLLGREVAPVRRMSQQRLADRERRQALMKTKTKITELVRLQQGDLRRNLCRTNRTRSTRMRQPRAPFQIPIDSNCMEDISKLSFQAESPPFLTGEESLSQFLGLCRSFSSS